MKSFDSESRTVARHARERDQAHAQPRDLFSVRPAAAGRPRRTKPAPELAAARVLSRQLPRKRVSAEKKRIIHLICLNLVALLKRRSQEA
jgi:hypothetical protein